MPGQLKDKLPNRSLSGPELAAITKWELTEMLKLDPAFSGEIAYAAVALKIELAYVLPHPHPKHELTSRFQPLEGPNLTGLMMGELIFAEFDKMTTRDFIFGTSGAYRQAELTIRVVAHVAGPYVPDGKDHPGRLMGEAPLPPLIYYATHGEAPTAQRTSVLGLERKVKLLNPNIDRINHGLPIVVQRAAPPQPPPVANQLPGEPPPAQIIGTATVENLEFRYDPTQFPAPEAPVDSDVSQQAAAKLGVPVQTGAL